MAYTLPSTFAVGEVLTAATMNKLRTSLAYLGTAPAGRIYATAATATVASNTTFHQVTLGATTYTRGGMSKTGSGLKVPVTGYYALSATAAIVPGASTGVFQAAIEVNSVIVTLSGCPNSTGGVVVTPNDTVKITATQVIKLFVSQTSGSAHSTFIAGAVGAYCHLTAWLEGHP